MCPRYRRDPNKLLRAPGTRCQLESGRAVSGLGLRTPRLRGAELLVRRRQLGTDYRYFANLGFSYTFGSRFSNVVNPRMGGGQEFVFFFQ